MSNRQAVVIIHGIGEQRPLKTLRSFVTSLLNYEKYLNNEDEFERNWWIKPDKVNKSYELRKITAKNREDERSITHFYEYHWAPNMRDTALRHVTSWILEMLRRKPKRLSSKLRMIRAGAWIAIFIFLAFGITSLAVLTFPDLIRNYFPIKRILIPIVVITAVAYLFGRKFIMDSIGDAARYLIPDPDNIAQRQIIRKNGIDLLRALHQKGEYHRIILVGHSLGSVIAYDIITYLWLEVNQNIKVTERVQELLDKMLALAKDLKEDPESDEVQDRFEELQSEIWREIQECKMPKKENNLSNWLISDLVTIGSPLTHASWLMAESESDFKQRKQERQYPIIPPETDNGKYTYGKENKLHHATPFICIKWSNIFYPGDMIAGELSSKFGFGIRDIEMIPEKNSSFFKTSLSSHSRYWAKDSTHETIAEQDEYVTIQRIYNECRLNDIKHDLSPVKESNHEQPQSET